MGFRSALTLLAVLSLAALGAGCGSDGDAGEQVGGGTSGGSLTVYSGREEELVEPLFELFEEKTGIDVEVRYGDSAELAATLAEEGENSPADAFFAQDPGSLEPSPRGPARRAPGGALEQVDERFRDDNGRWVGTSGASASWPTTPTRSRKASSRSQSSSSRTWSWKGQSRHRADQRLLPGVRDGVMRLSRVRTALVSGSTACRRTSRSSTSRTRPSWRPSRPVRSTSGSSSTTTSTS